MQISGSNRKFNVKFNAIKYLPVFFLMMIFAFYRPGFAQELFLCRNVFIKVPIDRAQIQTSRDSQATYFRTGNRIVAVFIFNPSGTGVLEFRWIAPFKDRQPKPYFHQVKPMIPDQEYTAFAWITLDASIFDEILGAKVSGNWQIEVYFDNKKIASKTFQVI